MNRFMSLVLAVALLAAPHFAAGQEPLVEQASRTLSTIYTDETPGAVVVVSRDGEVLLNAAFGMADLELGVPMATDHVLRLASVSKQYAAAAMLSLVEDGKVALEDPISKFLPDFPAGEVTIHQLLNHTSGIKSYTSIVGYMDSERIRADLTTDELVAVFADLPVDFAPGESWAYNNSGYVLVGAILEAVTGKPWSEFLRESLLIPNGIESTNAYPDSAIVPGRVDGYHGPADEPERAPYLSMTQPHAAGALMAPAADVDRWQRALHGGQILSESMYRKMITPVGAAAEDGQSYGYGINVGDWFGQTAFSHGGGIFGFSTFALYLPDDKLSIVVLTNRAGPGPGWLPQDIALRLAGMATGRSYPIENAPADWSAERLTALQGTYRISENEIRTLKLIDGSLVSQRNGGQEFPVYPIDDDRLAFKNSLSWFSIERDDAGEIVSIALHSGWGGEPERAEKISDEVQTRQAVDVAEEQLKRLVGRYELKPGFVLEARITDGALEVQATGQPAIIMQAESPVKFFSTQVGADIVFDLPESGPATGLTLYQGGQEMPAPRLEDEADTE